MRALVCLVILALLLPAGFANAEPVAVRFPEGVTHGFVTLRGERGDVLAHGELIQAPKADSLDSRLVLRFKDGSLYEETLTFSQKRVFRLLAYKLVQRGPSFPEATEITFDRASGRYRAKVGDEAPAEGDLELPEDLHNGMTGMLVRNLPAGASGYGHVYAFTPKPRLLRTTMRPEAEDRYYVGDTAHTATRYLVTMEIGGLTGVVAGVLGKDPPDLRFWASTGPAPGFLKFEGAMFLNGPRWRIEPGTLRWPGERRAAAQPPRAWRSISIRTSRLWPAVVTSRGKAMRTLESRSP
jgi:hypothetical protein